MNAPANSILVTLTRLIVIGSAAKMFVDCIVVRVVAHAPLTTIPLVAVLGIALVIDGGLVVRALRLAFLGSGELLSQTRLCITVVHALYIVINGYERQRR